MTPSTRSFACSYLPARSRARRTVVRLTRIAVWSGLGLLAACTATPPVCAPAPTPAPTALATPLAPAEPVRTSAGFLQLQAAQRRYAAGDYAGTIDRLHASTDLWADSAAVRGEGYKLLAFSYCVTQRQPACRQAFESLLRVEPGFELSPTERGHPMWGPVFAKARAGQPH